MQQKNDNNPSFFDPKTIHGHRRGGTVYFGWNYYLKSKYPSTEKILLRSHRLRPLKQPFFDSSTAQSTPESKSEMVAAAAASPEKVFQFSNSKISFSLSSLGMGLRNFTVNSYQDKEKKISS